VPRDQRQLTCQLGVVAVAVGSWGAPTDVFAQTHCITLLTVVGMWQLLSFCAVFPLLP
jgi:hypothetical protein